MMTESTTPAPTHPAPDGSFDPRPTAANLASSLEEMLDCYWGDGDGDTPPSFITRAKTLVANFKRGGY